MNQSQLDKAEKWISAKHGTVRLVYGWGKNRIPEYRGWMVRIPREDRPDLWFVVQLKFGPEYSGQDNPGTIVCIKRICIDKRF